MASVGFLWDGRAGQGPPSPHRPPVAKMGRAGPERGFKWENEGENKHKGKKRSDSIRSE